MSISDTTRGDLLRTYHLVNDAVIDVTDALAELIDTDMWPITWSLKPWDSPSQTPLEDLASLLAVLDAETEEQAQTVLDGLSAIHTKLQCATAYIDSARTRARESGLAQNKEKYYAIHKDKEKRYSCEWM